MDCIVEAKKFVQRAREASHREVVDQNLAMADWYLAEALKERDEAPGEGRSESKPAGKAPRVA